MSLPETIRSTAWNWRSRRVDNALLAILILAILPNLIFLLVAPWLMVRRAFSPLIYILAAIPALFLPRAFAYPLFLAAVAIDSYLIVSFAFDMPFSTSFAAIRYIGSIDVAASLLYVAGIAFAVAVALSMAVLVNRYRARLLEASLTPALIAALGFCAIDLVTSGFKPLTAPATFDSAMQQNNLTAEALLARDRNVLFVLVEGMGAYADPRERALLEERLTQAVAQRFDLRHGVSSYYGSTTGATSRELCGRWGTFADYLAGGPVDCIPALLAKSGYGTTSYHAGYSDLFSRRDWYPKIGFETLNFREDIEKAHPALAGRLCGSVTLGLCDDDMGDLVHGKLLEEPGKRKFVYWLTLNSHVPFVPRKDGVLGCGTDKAAIRDNGPCHLTDIWIGVFDSIARIASDPDMPPLDIVVAGDHHTPIWLRRDFHHFINGKVDWYYLRDRRPALPRSQ